MTSNLGAYPTKKIIYKNESPSAIWGQWYYVLSSIARRDDIKVAR